MRVDDVLLQWFNNEYFFFGTILLENYENVIFFFVTIILSLKKLRDTINIQ